MNSVNIIGRFTEIPELKHTPSGKSVISFTLAVERNYKTEKNTVDFINCVAWENTADFISKNFSKGNRIGISGEIQSRKYEKDGKTITVYEVVVSKCYFCESKNTGTQKSNEHTDYDVNADDDECPF